MDGQSIIAILIVAASALVTIRHFWRRFATPKSKAGKCEDNACKGCPVKESCSSEQKKG